MSILSRLNGWQRLWLVLSVIYLIVVAGFTVTLMPKASQYLSSRVYDTVRTIKDNVPELSLNTSLSTFEIREAYSDLSDEELIQIIHNLRVQSSHDYGWIQRDYVSCYPYVHNYQRQCSHIDWL